MCEAIDYEFNRHLDCIERGEKIIQETRCYDSNRKFTFSLRKKEDFIDYRYIPDYNIPAVNLTNEFIEEIRSTIVNLPHERREKYEKIFKKDIVEILVSNMHLGNVFDLLNDKIEDKVLFVNLLITDAM
jgi:aspartyl-tRNA(Asn)/glutamyl-tRNA(Gln) amidotransferase subunit B